MKKAILILAAVALLFVTACGSAETTNTGTQDTPPADIQSSDAPDSPSPEVSAPAESNTPSPDVTPAETDMADDGDTDAETPAPTDSPAPAADTTPAPAADATPKPTPSSTPEPTPGIAPEPSTTPSPEPSPEPVATRYKDGTYRGSAWGYESNIVVDVTIAGDVITTVKLVEHADDDIYVQDAVLLIPDVVRAQSADVDAVSGATATSDGIKNAIKAALAKAEN